MTRPDKQGELTKITPWGPSTTEGGKMVDGATKDWIPTTPEHLKNAVPLDQQWWAENFNKVNTQFQQWLLK
jgi:putative spermidine/putrescine transport system substrate-binding protein